MQPDNVTSATMRARACSVLLLVLACYRHDASVLRDAQVKRAGAAAIDCRDRPDCMVAAFEKRQPFHGRICKQGIDSELATGYALDVSGTMYVYRFDSAPCGAPGRCAPLLEERVCAQPHVRDGALACTES